MKETVLLRINTMVKHIDSVMDNAYNLTIEQLEKSEVLLKATCFSIMQIGEMMIQLEKHLGPYYKDLPWADARGMRNRVAHDYTNIDVFDVYETIHKDLIPLKEKFLEIKEDIKNHDC